MDTGFFKFVTMELLTPNLGLIVWTTLVFLIVLYILSRFAWKPIMSAIRQREVSIESSLKSAEKAREEMAALSSSNEKLLAETREERSKILKEAKEIKESIISEAREGAKIEAAKILEDNLREIENKKQAVISDIKNQTGQLALEIAERLIEEKLKENAQHEALVAKLIDQLKVN